MFNVREGFSRKDDTLPQRVLTEELKKGSSEGQRISNQDVFLDQYYDLRGWDRSGIPTAQRLKELGLEYLVKDIRQVSP
jgi:aldehyde:ferredoxin oxidoreductase